MGAGNYRFADTSGMFDARLNMTFGEEQGIVGREETERRVLIYKNNGHFEGYELKKLTYERLAHYLGADVKQI